LFCRLWNHSHIHTRLLTVQLLLFVSDACDSSLCLLSTIVSPVRMRWSFAFRVEQMCCYSRSHRLQQILEARKAPSNLVMRETPNPSRTS
jgi:hypothetical protein